YQRGRHTQRRPAQSADVLFVWLLLAAIPFALPIASWVAARRTRARVEELSRTIRDQQSTIDTLSIQIAQLKRAESVARAPETESASTPAEAPAPPTVRSPVTRPVAPPIPPPPTTPLAAV